MAWLRKRMLESYPRIVSWGISLAVLFAALPTIWNRPFSDKVPSPVEEVSEVAFMQTFQHVISRNPSPSDEAATPSDIQQVTARSAQADDADTVIFTEESLNLNFEKGTVMKQNSSASTLTLSLEAIRELRPCSLYYMPELNVEARMEAAALMQEMGKWVAPKEKCEKEPPVVFLSLHSRMAAVVESATGTRPSPRTWALLVPLIFLAFFGFIVLRMLWHILTMPAWDEAEHKRTFDPNRRPELEAWNQGLLTWFSTTWAEPWIRRWGFSDSPDLTKVAPEEIDNLGMPEDEPWHNLPRLDMLWSQEVERMGMEQANLMKVLLRFVTIRTLLKLGMWSMSYEVIMFLGPPIALQWTCQFVEGLYVQRLMGVVVEPQDLAIPTIIIMCVFTGMPLFIAISNTLSTFLNMRVGIQSCGALSSLIFQKAQRLPIGALSNTPVLKEKKDSRLARMQELAAEEAESRHEQSKKKKKSGEESDDDGDRTTDAEDAESDDDIDVFGASLNANGEWAAPESFNLVQVISQDVNMSFIQIPMSLMRILVLAPITIILLGLVCLQIRLTILLVILSAALSTWAIRYAAGLQIGYLLAFMNYAGKRLQFMENIIISIRTVKAYGWEDVIEKRIKVARGNELIALECYYWRLGLMYGISYSIPKVLILSAVWGFCLLYPNSPHLTIFAILPLLMALQTAIINLVSTLPMILNARPAIIRAQGFLKQKEAPCGAPRSMQCPSWLTMWPEGVVQDKNDNRAQPALPAVPEGEEDEEWKTTDTPKASPVPAEFVEDSNVTKLRIKGSFTWNEKQKPVLKKVDISLKVGQKLGILGEVGSGKSTLLHAMLGELYPVGDSRVEIPATNSYSAQVPYITEGTLRENVLYNESGTVDETKYKNALFAACLLPDLEVLPGGEDVPIGARGITLSGGQKARVSLARAAYFSKPGGLVLIDDPFGAVDARTGKHIQENYLHGEPLKGRTVCCVMQPDRERIEGFDKIVIMSKGKPVAQGTPAEVMATQAYVRLLNSHQQRTMREESFSPATPGRGTGETFKLDPSGSAPQTEAFNLREEESQARVNWEAVTYFVSTGGTVMITACVGFFLVLQIVYLFMNVTLQNWATDQVRFQSGMTSSAPSPLHYLWPFLYWWATAQCTWLASWWCGVNFTMKLSNICHMQTIRTMLLAPIDKFFDKTPTGRIMNRLSADLMGLDTNTYLNITCMIGLGWMTLVPIGYIHVLTPLYFTALSLPFYFLMYQVTAKYWVTMVPMRYLAHVSKSFTDDLLTETETAAITTRAMQTHALRMKKFQYLVVNQIKADLATSTILKRWLVNRLFLTSGFFVTCIVLLGIWIPNAITFGGIGLCLVNCFGVICQVETYIDQASGAQFQFISMNRLYEYTKLPQEKPARLEGDNKYTNFAVWIRRSDLGNLEVKGGEGGTMHYVVRQTPTGPDTVLEQIDGTHHCRAPNGLTPSILLQLADTRFSEEEEQKDKLRNSHTNHILVAVGSIRNSVKAMLLQLCNGDSEYVKMEFQSSWMSNGAEVVIEDLKAGYGDIPRNILQDINIRIEPRCKAAIVGTTGCGKSTLMLCLLRILEPRGGKVMLNGVNAQDVGIATMRQAIGMVAQDPVLMSASVRDNLDPMGFYNDEELWNALRMVRMEQPIKDLEGGLKFPLVQEGSTLSFGQRQLLCLARTAVKQPPLLLLDEATSALDPNTQEIVQTAIENQFPNSTIVVIAHRLETIMNFDMIIVLNQGQLVEKGSVKELSGIPGGRFASMLAAKQTW